MLKNTSGQKAIFFAFDITTGAAKTGDAANITPYESLDYGSVTGITDASMTEMEATNAKGYYLCDLTQAETNANRILFSAKSSTANVSVIGVPALVFTRAVTADVNVAAIDGSTSAATHLKDHTVTAVPVTFTTGGSMTTAVLVNVDGAAASSTDDFYNGRVLIFSAPAGLKDQATDITDYVGSTKTATITQVTTAPDATTTAIMV